MKLTVENLSFSYGENEVLKNIEFSVRSGEFISVLGPNGAGKSTLFKCILKSLREYEGKVCVDGVDTRTLNQRKMAQKIAYIPQIHRPTFGYTVLDTVLMGTCRQVNACSIPKKDQIEQAHNALSAIGIQHLAARSFDHLSGGEQQLVLISRAIAQQSEIIIMDEPTSALDYGNQLRILSQVKKLSKEGYGVLISTHNPQHALEYADGIIAISKGEIIAQGDPKEMLTPKLIEELYKIDVDIEDTSSGYVILPKVVGCSL